MTITTRRRRLYLLGKPTSQGWHQCRDTHLDVCCRCHQPRHLWADVCTEFMIPIEQPRL